MKKRFQIHLWDDEKDQFWKTSDILLTEDDLRIPLEKLFPDQKPIFLHSMKEMWYFFDSDEKLIGKLEPIEREKIL